MKPRGLFHPTLSLHPPGRCFWPLYRAWKNLSTQRPRPTAHRVFLKGSAPPVEGFASCWAKYVQLLNRQAKLENGTPRSSHSPVGEGNGPAIPISQNGKIFMGVSLPA